MWDGTGGARGMARASVAMGGKAKMGEKDATWHQPTINHVIDGAEFE
jgi:hypothetical protein